MVAKYQHSRAYCSGWCQRRTPVNRSDFGLGLGLSKIALQNSSVCLMLMRADTGNAVVSCLFCLSPSGLAECGLDEPVMYSLSRFVFSLFLFLLCIFGLMVHGNCPGCQLRD